MILSYLLLEKPRQT